MIRDRKDDFPAPDGPIIVRKSPLWTSPDKLSRILFMNLYIQEIHFPSDFKSWLSFLSTRFHLA